MQVQAKLNRSSPTINLMNFHILRLLVCLVNFHNYNSKKSTRLLVQSAKWLVHLLIA